MVEIQGAMAVACQMHPAGAVTLTKPLPPEFGSAAPAGERVYVHVVWVRASAAASRIRAAVSAARRPEDRFALSGVMLPSFLRSAVSRCGGDAAGSRAVVPSKSGKPGGAFQVFSTTPARARAR